MLETEEGEKQKTTKLRWLIRPGKEDYGQEKEKYILDGTAGMSK